MAYPKIKNINGQQVTIIKQLSSKGDNFIYQILCIACSEPKSIYGTQLKHGVGLMHVKCSGISRSNKASSKVWTRERDEESIVGFIFASLRGRKKRKGRDFSLTEEEIRLIIFSNCFYCGTVPNLIYPCNGRNLTTRYIGIDRVNNSLGYITNNCVPCCAICNRAKSTMRQEEFLEWINRLKSGIGSHITEIRYPQQTKRFREILDEMYQVHLDKNRDYSPMNILATGMVGVSTRIWDKTARILNLMGFNLQTGEYSVERKSTNDESIEDNLKDLGVYSIIARLLREGKWGK